MANKLHVLAVAGLASGLVSASLIPSVFADTTTTTVITQSHHTNGASADAIRVVINDQVVEFNGPGPIMIDGSHVFVPIRGIFEKMGGDVQWHPHDQTIEGAKPGHMFRIRVGSNQGVVNGSNTTLAVSPELIGGTTYVPLRFASEALGASVRWQSDTNTVSILTHDSEAASGMGGDTDHAGIPGSTTTTIIKKVTTP